MEIIFALFFFTAFILAIFVFIIKPLFNLLFESTSSKSKLKNFASNALTEMAKRKEEKLMRWSINISFAHIVTVVI